ncbi:MAG: LysE/ArgO family amino acid transporter [Ahrensia sp.]|nr:LysE/ArgO family amino acid transporter [Ahrensia sp.]
MTHLLPALEGFALGGGLIVAIGAQNAFILRQGLLRAHVFQLCLVAGLSDAALIALGVFGFGTLVRSSETLLLAITIGGAVFLAAYAVLAARRAMTPSTLEAAKGNSDSASRALAILLSFTFLNPHVYLDTVVLVGGISGQYVGSARIAFAVGAMSASFAWFFALGYGARLLAPLFAKPMAWRVLDGLIAIVMALISLSLFWRALASS